MKPTYKTINIPIFKCTVILVICDSIRAELQLEKNIKLFGEQRQCDYDGLCIATGLGLFGLYFDRNKISQELITHEVYHLTNAILRHHNITATKDNEECAALLNGYLNELFNKIVWNISFYES